ncbi:DEAD/DEAH box helicase [Candidatus Thorarchaeota archaeon]|nr:MAG: DEAD/DEAH box helicase [Candidatus Thorarchaeota archaeon]
MTTMKTFPDTVRFSLTWRPYQARVLKELEEYLEDDKLHIVAAPGSGKTVLGIEVLRRFNTPTLVLAPTLAIRDQWIHRFIDLFLPKGSTTPDWISSDLSEPRFFTVATYQSLHAAMMSEVDVLTEIEKELDGVIDEEVDDSEELDFEEKDFSSWLNQTKKKRQNKNALLPPLMEQLKALGLKTIVLDEAHHLRTNWWKSLAKLVDSIKGLKILSLTATPPFDVSDYEWNRYVELCGPVDAQIAIPELVMVGNLCPHQDLIVFSTPSEAEEREIKLFRYEIDNFVKWIRSNVAFINHISSNQWIIEPEKYIEDILSEPEYYSSMLIFLKDVGFKISKDAVRIVADDKSNLPKFSMEWLEVLLTRVLYPPGPKRPKHPEFILEIHDELKRIGALDLRKVQLRNVKSIEKLLKRSISKLQRIEEITQLEVEALEDNLRMVVLTDYIRNESMPKDNSDISPLNRIGVIPIFETIRRLEIKTRLGVLCGSIVIIPVESKNLFIECANKIGIEELSIQFKQLEHDASYIYIEVSTNDKHKLVSSITDLFALGGINVLVGTKSLLGEGWDAPSINSLVIASFVGSYMLSNQMRGRAIRSQSGNPNKTANIWHLVCVEPKMLDGGRDYDTMSRRFKAFVGVSDFEPVIQNGVDRLVSEKPPFNKKQLESLNKRMFSRAKNRDEMKEKWEEALHRGEEGIRLVEDIQTKKIALPRGFVFWNTISYLFWEATFIFALIMLHTAESWVEAIIYSVLSGYIIFGLVVFGILLLVSTPLFFRAIWLLIRHGPVESSMRMIGIALLRTLIHIGEVQSDYSTLAVITKAGEYGEVYCHLEGGKAREKSVFLKALQEILNPIENPRYIMVRKSRLLFIERIDYHTVPAVIAAKKEHAQFFAEMWAKYVGKMKLIYTRNKEGRIELLRARNKSLSAAFRPKTERITRWQ